MDAHQSRRHYGRVFDYRWSARKFDKTTITGVAVEQSWLSLLIMMWFQIPTIMVALHFYT